MKKLGNAETEFKESAICEKKGSIDFFIPINTLTNFFS